MNFDKYTHPHTLQIREYNYHLKKFFSPLLKQSLPTPPIVNHCYDSYHHNLVLPTLELHKNGIVWYVLLCVWLLLLNVMFWGFCVVADISSFIAE